MKYFGFSSENEYLPSFDKFQSEINKRLMFLKFFNQEVDENYKFSKEEIKECKRNTLFELFIKKIVKNLKYSSYSFSPIKKIDVEKTNKINKFIKNLNEELKFEFKNFDIKNTLEFTDINKAYFLIDILENKDFSLFLEGEKIFKNFVSNKIIYGGENREVFINNDSIDIKSELHSFCTKIFTFWEFIDAKNLNIDAHIKKAVECIETTEFKQVYLVYPKNENFNKHIQVKTDEVTCGEYEIKLIPYSLRSTLR
jgi:hypothetical protein